MARPIRKQRWGKGKIIPLLGIEIERDSVNPLTPNDPYRGRTAQLTSKVAFYVFIQQIYVLNILNTVYFSSKYSLFHNSNVFGSRIIRILYTGCAKI